MAEGMKLQFYQNWAWRDCKQVKTGFTVVDTATRQVVGYIQSEEPGVAEAIARAYAIARDVEGEHGEQR